MTDHLVLLRSSLPPSVAKWLPQTFAQAQSVVAKDQTAVVRFDVCRNECFLWETPRVNGDICPKCQELRLDPAERPCMVFRYLPLKSRIRRLFASEVDLAIVHASHTRGSV
jgi:hypothetical protein